MLIDEGRTHVLTKYATTKGGKQKVESDHNVMYSRFSVSYKKIKMKTLREVFNFKNGDGQAWFLEATKDTKKFTSCFEDPNLNIER